MTTLKDIAAAAGVSIGTVDRALKDRGRVNPQVAQHIKDLAKEMDYHPNKIASGLVNRSRNYKIAVILHITGNDFFNEVLKGVKKAEKEIRDYGMSVDIYPCDDFDASMHLSNIEKAIENGANAIIIVPINDPCISKKIRQLNKDNIPVVFLTAYLNRIAPLSSIHCDYYRSGRIGARLLQLISGGNGHVMAFFPSSAMFGNNSRKQGFESYFTEASTTLSLTGVIELTNNPVKNLSLVREELTIHPEVDHIIFNGDSSIALSVLTELDRPVKAVFYDFSAETKAALKSGLIDAAILQAPKDQGYQSVNVLFQYFSSKKIPQKEILMESQILLKECID